MILPVTDLIFPARNPCNNLKPVPVTDNLTSSPETIETITDYFHLLHLPAIIPVPCKHLSMVSDLLVPLVVASLVSGFILGYYYVKAQVRAIEDRYRAELERWKAEAETGIRRDSVNRARSTLKGKIAEQMAPVLPDFGFNPADARFIGSPIDYIIFDGLTAVSDEKDTGIRVVLMDVKQGTSTLNRTQRIIKKAVEEKRVSWQTYHIGD